MAKEMPNPQKRVKRVVRRRKPDPSLLESTIGVAMSYIWDDVIVPQMRDMLFETVTEGAQHMIYRESMGRPAPRKVRGRRGARTDYNASSRQPRRAIRKKSKHNFTEEVFDTRQEAQDALDNLQAALEEYGVVTVADVYDVLGITSSDFSDNNWGWYDLKGARVGRGTFGFNINLPDPLPLD